MAAPVTEHAPGMRYEVVGSRVHVVRPFVLATERQPRELVYIVWAASGNFGLPLLAALIVATPGWGWGARARALGWGLGLLTLTQVAFMLVTLEFWQQMPVRDPRGGLLYLPGHSSLGLRIVSPLYYFFEIVGRGFFALIIYLGLIAVGWTAPEAIPPVPRERPVGRNDPCPCGSGRKYKRCCLA